MNCCVEENSPQKLKDLTTFRQSVKKKKRYKKNDHLRCTQCHPSVENKQTNKQKTGSSESWDHRK